METLTPGLEVWLIETDQRTGIWPPWTKDSLAFTAVESKHPANCSARTGKLAILTPIPVKDMDVPVVLEVGDSRIA
jgi:hypothetical protein